MAQPTGTKFEQKEEDIVVTIHDTAPMGNDTEEMKVGNPVRFQFQEQQISMVNQGLRYIRRFSLFLRLIPFDTSISGGLAHERYRRAVLTSVTSVIAKCVSLLTILISVPLTLNYLGTERYGLWMIISSVIVMLGFADFGLGDGLVNAIASADGKNDHDGVQKAVASVFFMLLGSAFLLLLVFTIVYPFVPWYRIFNVISAQSVREAGPATAIFVMCFILSLPLGIAQRIQVGYQEGFLNNYWQIAGNVLGLLAVVTVIKFQGSLPWLVFAMSGVPVLVVAANWCFLFFYRYPLLLPRWSNFNYTAGKSLLGTGFIFVFLGIANIIGTSTDNIIIAQSLGASEVATYAVVQRLFSLMTLVQFATFPFWPAYSEALARLDYAWVRSTFNYGLALAVGLTFILGLLLLAFGRPIINAWAGPQVLPSWFLIIAYTFFNLFAGVNTALTPIMQTGLFVRRLLLIATTAGLVSLILKIALVPIWQSAGVAIGGAVAYGLFFTIPAILFVYKKTKRLAVNFDTLRV